MSSVYYSQFINNELFFFIFRDGVHFLSPQPLHSPITRFHEHIPVFCQRDPTHTLPQPHTHTKLPISHVLLFLWGFTIQDNFLSELSQQWSIVLSRSLL